MKIRGKILSLCIIPIMMTGIISIIISFIQFSNGMYAEIRESLKASAIAAMNVYSSQGYGNYARKDDGNVWRGMNFNVSEEEGIVDSIKDETGVDITFFYEDTAVMTSMKDENGNRYMGMKTGENITNYTLLQGAQLFYRKIDIGGEIYHAYIIPITQPDSGEVIGALMATRSIDSLENTLFKNSMTMVTAMVVIIVIFVIGIAIFVNAIVKEIKNAGNIVKNVSVGRLNGSEHKTARKDEIGELGNDIDSLQKKLLGIVGTINASSDVLNTASGELSETASSTLDAAREMSSAVETITQTTVDQAEESKDISLNMQHMEQMLENSMQEVNVVQEISTEMHQLSTDTSAILTQLEKCNEKSKQAIAVIYEQTNVTNTSAQDIKVATGFITSIAEETSLLALNASIEAARAGEQGKGFAVVASEIQKLAEQSNASARQIEEIVTSLLEKTGNTVTVMEEVKDIMAVQSNKVNDTQVIFSKLEDNIARSADKIERVSRLTMQIDGLKHSIMEIVGKFAESAESNAAVAEETSAMTAQVANEFEKVSELANELRELAAQLDENMTFFSYE